MKNRGLMLFLLFVPLLALTLWLGDLEVRYAFSPKVYVAASGYDPRDLLSGHYLNLQLDWNKTDCTQFADSVCPKERFNWNYRYYLPEADALYLEKEIFKASADLKLEFAFPKTGAPVIRNLLLDNMDWKEWINHHQREE